MTDVFKVVSPISCMLRYIEQLDTSYIFNKLNRNVYKHQYILLIMGEKEQKSRVIVGFRLDKAISDKLDVAARCRFDQKQDLFKDMIKVYFKKHPLTVSELNILERRTK